MKKFFTSIVCGVALAAMPLTASADLGQGSLMFPNSTLISSRPGEVTIMWNTNVVATASKINVKLTAPGVNNANVPATVTDRSRDEGTDVGGGAYAYTTLDFDLGQFVTEPNLNRGPWTVTIPAGIVCDVNNPSDTNPEQTIVFEWYKENDEFIIDPAFGSLSEAPAYNSDLLNNVSITWNGIVKVTRNTSVKGACLYIGSSQNTISLDSKISVSGDALILDLSDVPVGKYRLFLPTAYLFLTNSNDVDEVNGEISSYNNWFSVFEGLSSGQPQAPFEPTAGTLNIPSSQMYVDVAWPGQNIQLSGNGTVKLYCNEYKDFTPVEIPASNLSIQQLDGVNSVLRIQYGDVPLNEYFWSPARLINIPEGLVENEFGSKNPEQSIFFNVVNMIETEPDWTPANGSKIDPSNPITLSWSGATWINYLEDVYAYLEDGAGAQTNLKIKDDFFPNGQIYISGEENDVVKFDFSAMNLADGIYKIVMPLGAFSMSSSTGTAVVNPDMEYKFTVGDVVEQPEPEYIDAPMTVSPANNSIIGNLGNIEISWKGQTLAIENDAEQANQDIDLSYVTVTVNGVLNTEWKNDNEASFKVVHQQTSDEQHGGGLSDGGYKLDLYLGFGSFFWKGEINIVIAEGAVANTEGAINREINLTYNVKGTTEWDDAYFEPASGAQFDEGTGEITVKWKTPGTITFNPESGNPVSVVLYEKEDGAPVETIPMGDSCAIVDNALVVDLSELEPGFYSLTVPEGAIFIGDDYMNFEIVDYSFEIVSKNTDGVKGIDANGNELTTVVSLDGKVMYRGAGNPAKLNPGIYVVNGKKVVVK